MNMTMDTSTTRPSTVVGVFEDHEHAREAIEALKDEGFDADSISVLAPDKQVTRDIADDTGSHAGSGAATGAVAARPTRPAHVAPRTPAPAWCGARAAG